MCYPVCWGISEGGNVISPASEFIFYGILDCCLIPITSAFFLAAHWRIDPARLGLYMRTYDDPVPLYNSHAAQKERTEGTHGTNGHDTTAPAPAAAAANGNGVLAPDQAAPANV